MILSAKSYYFLKKILVVERRYFLIEVRTEFLNIIQMAFVLQKIKSTSHSDKYFN
jgi:hypothetical protein